MLESMTSLVRNTLIGAVIFVTLVAGGTYYLQSSLLLVKHYNAYTHWAAILFALPVMAGIAHRIAKINYPLVNVLCGTLISAAILYPQYKKLWAVPPTLTDTIIYVVIIFGIGYIATQPVKTVFMMAFRMGRYSIHKISKPSKQAVRSKTGKKPPRNNTNNNPQYNHALAVLELAIGACSLGLSIFSVFFLSQG